MHTIHENTSVGRPTWFNGPAGTWTTLCQLAEAMLAKERRRLERLAYGLAGSAVLILLGGIVLSRAMTAHAAPQTGTALTTAVLMLIVFVIVGGFQVLHYLEQHALDVAEESRFLEVARQALRRGEVDTGAMPSSPETPVEHLIRRETGKIRAAQMSAHGIVPALWGAGLAVTTRLRGPQP
ncbi:hypothetical protein [Pseudothauera rhizosphaerae]|uniref:Uncharacterized protein n=1 Tax=Pseudothauera rhizosphaerae TaxID=2565932 RepID=A0A4S4ANW9_9RHOO|nr:hypothetical protein [Pseudothauera rhizosphaerae]THF61302.1 hypothetical protein E6O51_10800 [Pseudothauera rhizosphaerae]